MLTSNVHRLIPLLCQLMAVSFVVDTMKVVEFDKVDESFRSQSHAKRHRLVKRLIGGSGYEEGKWPWLVSLQGKVPDTIVFGIPLSYQRFYCGASLLNERWLLTAAHCFTETKQGSRSLQPQYWHAKLGEVELTSTVMERLRGLVGRILDVDELRHWYIHAEKIIIHPYYDSSSMWKNDIALVKLTEDVPATDDVIPNIRSIQLIEADNMTFPTTGQTCVMKGWGCTANGGPVAGTAQEVVMPKISDSDCSQFWGIPATLRMCAGYSSTATRGICSGDSGGPLVCHNGREWIQVGVASFTSASRPGNVPGVFTRVSKYVRWIREVILDDWRNNSLASASRPTTSSPGGATRVNNNPRF